MTLPPDEYAAAWDVVIDTGGVGRRRAAPTRPGRRSRSRPRSVVVLREHAEPEAEPDHSVAASLAALQAAAPRPTQRTAHGSDCRCARPTSTYRLQITEDFDLFEARRRLPYLHDLGVDWVYLSPLLAAEPGSTHGYDVVATTASTPSRGGAEGLAALSAEARRLGHGRARRHRAQPRRRRHPGRERRGGGTCSGTAATRRTPTAFDVDWAAGDGRIRIPVVGDDDQAADGGPIAHLAVVDGELRYHDHRFPIAPGTADDGSTGERRRERRARPPALRAGQLAASPTTA